MRPNYFVSRQKTRFFKFWVPKNFSIFMSVLLDTKCMPTHVHTNFFEAA